MTFAVGIAPCAPIIHLAQTTSTNDELGRRWRARHQTPIAPYTALLTDYQTRGRGRLDRPWMAPAKTSVLASILVPTRAADATWVPLAAGLAVTRVLERTLTPTNPSTRESGVTLKWPNDVLINGEKVAGILAEYLGQDEEGISWVTLGVGINISQSPSELPPPGSGDLPFFAHQPEPGVGLVTSASQRDDAFGAGPSGAAGTTGHG